MVLVMVVFLGFFLGVSVLLAVVLAGVVMLQRERILESRVKLSAAEDWIRRMGGEYRNLAELALHREVFVPPIPPTPPTPALPDLAGIVKAVTEGYAMVVNPPATVLLDDKDNPVKQIDYGEVNPTDLGVKQDSWFPDIEFDTMMGDDPSKWPAHGGWVAGQPNTGGPEWQPTPSNGAKSTDTQTRTEPGLRRTGSGQVFRAGEGSTSPPDSSVEK